jgi:succinyl-diaminopimelate desuccinylase
MTVYQFVVDPVACMSDTLSLSTSLLSRRSITPDDAGCQELLIERLSAIGFICERMRSGAVSNLWAYRAGASADQFMVFAGHTDVVSPGPEAHWSSPPFSPTVEKGRLFARGAVDMKCSIAAFVIACEEFLRTSDSHSCGIGFIITSDEEGTAVDGTVKVVDELERRGLRIPYCVVGEPTSASVLGDTIKHGRRGSLSGRLIVNGVQGHVAYPHLAINPIHSLAPALAEMAAQEWDQGDEYFPSTTFQVSNLSAGAGANNMIPGTAEVLFNFRFSPLSTVEQLTSRIEQILERHHVAFDIQWTVGAQPFIKRIGRLIESLNRAIRARTGLTPNFSTSGGTSDARFITRIADEIAEFGLPGGSAHHVDESVLVSDLDLLQRIYLDVLEDIVR